MGLARNPFQTFAHAQTRCDIPAFIQLCTVADQLEAHVWHAIKHHG